MGGFFGGVLRCTLLLVTGVALGRAAIFFVTALAGFTVSSFLVDGDFGRSAFMACCAVHLLFMGFVVEGHGAFFALISHCVYSISQGEGKGDQHHSNNQFFHVSLLGG